MKVVYLDGETSVALYVKASSSKPDSSFVTQVNSQLLEFDDPEELLAQLPPEARLKLEIPLRFHQVEGGNEPVILVLTVRRNGDRLQKATCFPFDIPDLLWQASTRVAGNDVETSENEDLDEVLHDLREKLRASGCFQICDWCKFSDVEPQTGFGHLYCLVERRKDYVKVATSGRSGSWSHNFNKLTPPFTAVSEFHSCGSFEVRPANWGYRG